jgi:hypothetical protein
LKKACRKSKKLSAAAQAVLDERKAQLNSSRLEKHFGARGIGSVPHQTEIVHIWKGEKIAVFRNDSNGSYLLVFPETSTFSIVDEYDTAGLTVVTGFSSNAVQLEMARHFRYSQTGVYSKAQSSNYHDYFFGSGAFTQLLAPVNSIIGSA